MRHEPGFLLAILGPDGTGKSTLAQRLLAWDDLFPAACLQHVRPRLFGRRDIPNAEPHAHPCHGPFKSLLKLGYMAGDYVLGYWLITRRRLRRGALCISDRYYHDLLVDPARYHYGLPVALAEALAPVIPKPDLTLVLVAAPEVILARKNELPTEELLRQCEAYRALADRSPDVVVLDAGLPSDEVLAQAQALIRARVQGRPRGRRWFGMPRRAHAAAGSPAAGA